jgi:phage-related protein
MQELPGKMLEIGKNIVDGLFKGIKNAWEGLKKSVGKLFGSFVDGIKDGLGIKSPSRVFAEEVGQWIPKGISVGIDANTKSVSDSLNKVKTMAKSMNLQYEYGLGAIDASKKTVNTTVNSPINLTIEHFENKSDTDIKGIVSKMEYYRRQLALAKGGND